MLAELAAYLGGGFLVAGTVLGLTVGRPGWSAVVRVGVPLVGGVVLAAVAVLARRPWASAERTGPARRRLASTLAALAALAVAVTAAQVAGPEPGDLAVTVPTAVAALAGYLVIGGAVALFACWASMLAVVYAVVDRYELGTTWLVVGFALTGGGWLGLAGLARLPAWQSRVAAVLGGLTGLFAAQAGVVAGDERWLGLTVGALFVLACFARYRTAGQPVMLAPVVLIALLVPATAFGIPAPDTQAAGPALAAAGAALLAVAAVGLRYRRPQPAGPQSPAAPDPVPVDTDPA